MTSERRRVIYRGRVQGVGFRASVKGMAAGFLVAGSVRNLHDGGVEVVAEGEVGEVSAFLDAIAAEMSRNIRDARHEAMPPGGPPLSGFAILH